MFYIILGIVAKSFSEMETKKIVGHVKDVTFLLKTFLVKPTVKNILWLCHSWTETFVFVLSSLIKIFDLLVWTFDGQLLKALECHELFSNSFKYST